MPMIPDRPSFAAAARAAAVAFGMALAGSAPAAEPGGCPELSGEYENRAVEASSGEVYLSDILGIAPGVTRIVWQSRPDGMILRAPHYNLAMYELFVPWGDFPCYGTERVLSSVKSNVALAHGNEGRPIGGSIDRRIAFGKSPEGALLVRYSESGNWYTAVLWGVAVSNIGGEGWARFDPYKKR
ncbi:MAG TPA: hypothetical protein VF104_09165 [Burkholderiales bacterium]